VRLPITPRVQLGFSNEGAKLIIIFHFSMNDRN